MKALVVNCSAPYYNLGARKLADWLRSQAHDVTYSDGDPGLWAQSADTVYLSVIFTWHAPIAREIALRFKGNADVECGGPGMLAIKRWWKDETGLARHRGLDLRFDHQKGGYKMTFASRGCPVGCSFCIVPKLEGLEFTFNPDFEIAPILCDNNLSMLPVEYQEHIIRRYQEAGQFVHDANSGFEPRAFDEGCYQRWKPVMKGAWRFAFDEMSEEAAVYRTMQVLKDIASKKKRVYCLVGNEPIAATIERARKIVEWGGEPYCQYILPLDWLGDPATLKHKYDWTYQRGKDFSRYFNRFLWKYVPLHEYNDRKGERPPFEAFAPKTILTAA